MPKINNFSKSSLIIIYFFCLTAFHPYHISINEMRYNTESHTIEMSCRLFINDLENVIKQEYGNQLDLYKAKAEDVTTTAVLFKYLQKNFAIQFDGKQIPYSIQGFEREDDALWIYLESAETNRPKQVEIYNALLYDLFVDQTNINHFQIDAIRKSYKASAPNA